MNTPLRTTVRRKLMTAMMLTTATALVLICVALVVYDVVTCRRESVRGLTTRAQMFAANASGSLAFDNPADARQVLEALRLDPSMTLGALYDRSGHLLACYPSDARTARVLENSPVPQHRFDAAGLVVLQPVTEGSRWLGTLVLRSDLRTIRARFRVYVMVVLLALLGTLGVTFVLSAWLQRGIASPISALARAVREVALSQDYAVRVRATSEDEVGLLVRAFNGMLEAIQVRDAALAASEAQQRAELEQRVHQRTAELEVLNRELESFSYSVSHDLRAPLRHVNGFADLLQRHAHEGLDEKGRRYLDHISDSARRMGQLIDDLLTFSRMARLDMGSVPVDLNELVRDVRELLVDDLGNRKIVWHVSTLPEVQGDPAMLRMAITNLMSNAIKYTSTRETAEIAIDATESADSVTISIRDNGVGFDMAYAAKLFGVFQRLHSAEEFEGTGIGLANVRRIIQRHGGTTWAEARVNEGATFCFSLPRVKRVVANPQREVA